MNHLIECPKCHKMQLFEYGDKTKKCKFHGCDGHEWTIEYNEALLRQVIEDLIHAQKSEMRVKLSVKNSQKLHFYPNGDGVLIPQ